MPPSRSYCYLCCWQVGHSQGGVLASKSSSKCSRLWFSPHVISDFLGEGRIVLLPSSLVEATFSAKNKQKRGDIEIFILFAVVCSSKIFRQNFAKHVEPPKPMSHPNLGSKTN